MRADNVTDAAPLGVIGGSGLYDLFAATERDEIRVDTPYGSVSGITAGVMGGRRVVFLPRHGSDHSVPPHRINARATVWALASLGVHAVVSTAAVGSLTPALPVGALVFPDQLVDRTHGRADTYFDASVVRHLPFSDPFGSPLRDIAVRACPDVEDGATVLVIQGPRFSTRAESRINRAAGIDLVNMTLYPEVALAAELGVDVVTLCLVTDVDSGESAGEAVTAEAVFALLAEARPRLVEAIERIVAAVPADYVGRRLLDDGAVAAIREQHVR